MRKLPKLITQKEFEKLFKAEKNKEIKLAMLLGFEAGMRLSEIVGLKEKICKCHLKQIITKKIEIEGKERKKKTRFCAVSNKELSSKEIKFGKDFDIKPLTIDKVDVASIFISQGKGEKDRIVPRPKRMNANAVKLLPLKTSRRTLQRHVTNLGRKLLGKEITFHTLRHGFGSHLAEKGRPLHEIQMLMGHSRLDTTGIYLHANPKKAIMEAIDVF